MQLFQIENFTKAISRSKLLLQILPLNRTLIQGNSFQRTCHTTLSTCKTYSMIPSTCLTTFSTRSTSLPSRITRFFTCSTRFSARSTRLSICLSTRRTRLSIRSICLSTRSYRSTICRSFYNWSWEKLKIVDKKLGFFNISI